MKIIVLLLLASWTIDSSVAEYPRYKIRGPPPPARPPQIPQYMKKWQHPGQRPPVRSGRPPIPVHMPPGHKIPIGIPQLNGRPMVAVPVRNFWKNTQQAFNIPPPEAVYIPKPEKPAIKHEFLQKPQEKPYVPPKEKPFVSAPQIKNHEIDYHIQTNSIPTHANPIKQVGEKGPIHTIPAPKLGPKDKPLSIEYQQSSHRIPENSHKYVETQQKYSELSQNYPETIVSVQKSHSYQVTEPPEPVKIYQQQQQQHQQQQHQQQHHQQQHHQQQQQIVLQPQETEPSADSIKIYQPQQQLQIQELQQPGVYFSLDSTTQPQTLALTSYDNQKLTQVEQSAQLTQKELQQLLTQQYPQNNFGSFNVQPVEDTASQTQQLYQQQVHQDNYQALLPQLQVYQQDIYRTSEPEEEKTGEKLNIQPEFHSFNYNEQDHQRRSDPQQSGSSSFVSAGYSLDSEAEANEPSSVSVSGDSQDAVAQAQAEYIQNYFQTKNDKDGDNVIEPDAKPSAGGDKDNEEILNTSYYSTLPNKQAADALNKLQSAGKVNSNLMKLSPSDIIKGKSPMKIYVPDEATERPIDPREYDDYPSEQFDEEPEEKEQPTAFGNRLKPKMSRI